MKTKIEKAANVIKVLTPSTPNHVISELGYERVAERVFEIFEEAENLTECYECEEKHPREQMSKSLGQRYYCRRCIVPGLAAKLLKASRVAADEKKFRQDMKSAEQKRLAEIDAERLYLECISDRWDQFVEDLEKCAARGAFYMSIRNMIDDKGGSRGALGVAISDVFNKHLAPYGLRVEVWSEMGTQIHWTKENRNLLP